MYDEKNTKKEMCKKERVKFQGNNNNNTPWPAVRAMARSGEYIDGGKQNKYWSARGGGAVVLGRKKWCCAEGARTRVERQWRPWYGAVSRWNGDDDELFGQVQQKGLLGSLTFLCYLATTASASFQRVVLVLGGQHWHSCTDERNLLSNEIGGPSI